MRNFLAFIGAAIVTFLGLGWYLDWYRITPQASGVPGHRSIAVDINQEKIGEDVQHGLQKGRDKLNEVLDKSDKSGEKPPKPSTQAQPLPFDLLLPPSREEKPRPVVPAGFENPR